MAPEEFANKTKVYVRAIDSSQSLRQARSTPLIHCGRDPLTPAHATAFHLVARSMSTNLLVSSLLDPLKPARRTAFLLVVTSDVQKRLFHGSGPVSERPREREIGRDLKGAEQRAAETLRAWTRRPSNRDEAVRISITA
ncbi:hypothetical protein [Polyangium sp. 6x1]|uniref:hypothetical protein n=1 Tax=Polyangium sp. 6x1 TaxID=3042689 RepID=UPI0024828702|nr:hypothetical protein [Polyangium sp. 6x1]MDI1450146.1 hypothetical protein [Polyangium sp. 6x1]